ncbi:MAG: hypothetical protein IJV90_04115 [Candidatus Methanomethylophilaceae archaeon]|nr:hypothetical protein [Thermoplasmata archaeon]MBP3385288.1 hypothetical protein [Candidatus Methanomethylophilaceae archaeon]MBQ7405584.1 hypothetical protein [Candidatus Methanomethylophilaceae archaeon]MBQ8643958.1 hypothetical protein [Candidatus Methanomethylophilaceae archaeon]MBR2347882.1 hypothetical protein [Candidatus Methanomethylophilaceae archaeon]
MVSVRIFCPVNPSEDEEKVKSAVLSIFPDAELELGERGFEGSGSLDKFSRLIRKQKILDATRGVLLANLRGDHTFMNLNKQVATVGKVSFSNPRPVLGAIQVDIEGDDLEALIDKVAPMTVDGEEVIL